MTLCAVMSNPPVCCTMGRRDRVTLLLKNPDQPIQEANLRGITIFSTSQSWSPRHYKPWQRLYTSGLWGALASWEACEGCPSRKWSARCT